MIKRLVLILVIFYQKIISPMTGPSCRFYPTCSSYTIQAVEKYGALRGLFLASCRILKCHPWHPGGYDPLL